MGLGGPVVFVNHVIPSVRFSRSSPARNMVSSTRRFVSSPTQGRNNRRPAQETRRPRLWFEKGREIKGRLVPSGAGTIGLRGFAGRGRRTYAPYFPVSRLF